MNAMVVYESIATHLIPNSFSLCEQKEMEATGKTDNLKTIVGMLLKKDKQNAEKEESLMQQFKSPEEYPPPIPEVAVTAAPDSPTSSNLSPPPSPFSPSGSGSPVSASFICSFMILGKRAKM